jgi:hypothetical protein
MLDHGGNDDTATIRAHGRLDHDTGNAAIITALKRANAKMGLDFAKVGPAGFIAPCIAGENLGGDANLRGNGDEHVGRRALPALREHGRGTSDRRDERQTPAGSDRRARVRRKDFVLFHHGVCRCTNGRLHNKPRQNMFMNSIDK